jgi:hypothetical protein
MSKNAAGAADNKNNEQQQNNGGGNNNNNLTRHLLVSINGNRATWEHMGMHGGLWQVNPDRAGTIFGCDDADTDKLSRAIIHNVTLIESSTNIDEVVGVHIDGLPSREFTQNGEGAAIFLTGEGRVTQPQEIFNMSGNTELGLAWMRQYPKYTNSNLDNEGVIFLTGSTFYFVNSDHPAVHMLKSNEEQLGVQINLDDTIEGGNWYKVDIEVFVYCVRQIRDNVLQNMMSTFNLGGLTVRISKPDGQRWLNLCPQLVNSLISDDVRESNDADLISDARRLAVQRYFDRPLYVTLRLKIEYSLPATSTESSTTLTSTTQQLNISKNNNNTTLISSSNTTINNNNTGQQKSASSSMLMMMR